MALTLPNLTWELQNERVLSPINDANEYLTELKALITGTTAAWRVLDDDIGAGDSYLWIAGPTGSPVEDMRIFYWLSKATTPVHANNRATNQSTSNAATVAWAGISPDDAGATPNATDPTAATLIFNSRNTGLGVAGYWANNSDRIACVASAELLFLCQGIDGGGTWYPCLFGPWLKPQDDAGGESGDNGRIYGMVLSTFGIGWDFYTATSWPMCTGVTNASQAKAYIMDPANPSNAEQVLSYYLWSNSSTYLGDNRTFEELHGSDLVQIHMSMMFNLYDVTAVTGYRRIGVMRQVRIAPSSQLRDEVRSGGSGPAKSVLFCDDLTARSPTIAFDNDGA